MSLPGTESASTDKANILQEQKLQELLLYLSIHSPFYPELLAKNQVDIAVIKKVTDLPTLPTTSKEDLQQHDNNFLCVDPDKIIEYTSTSGTLGSPVSIALTENDLNRLTTNEYNSFVCADGNAADTYQLMLTLDRQFMAGIAYFSRLRKLGGGSIPLGAGGPFLHWGNIKRLKPTAIVAV